ncbi:MAG: hypothetical protein RMJ81_02270 [Candidatus Kryptonium sp.]|nr:hypothetical protein [Candidatus Kryptonium sp.]MDW8108463.1 hypothetical protein [Candidatus Kryptonium sp.]
MINKNLIILTAIISLFLLTGCGPAYLPAIYDSAPPMYVPSEVKGESNFISGYYNQTGGLYEGESNKFLRANFARAVGGSWYRFSGCGFAYFGQYDVKKSEDISERGKKSYFGLGGDVDANIFLPISFINAGIGVYGGLATEFGDYSKVWRENGNLLTILIPYASTYLFTQFNITKSDKLTFRFSIGLPGGHSVGVSYYNINYGGLWIAFHPTEEADEISFSSIGISINIK